MNKADPRNIERGLKDLSRFNATPDFGTTRLVFSQEDIAARNYIKDSMRALGLDIEEDSIGNIFGILRGTDPELPMILTGSHIDTVLNAGNFDGMTGVIGGLEAVRLIKTSGLVPQRSIAVIVYTSEEPTRFGLSCLGSRALAGELTLEQTKDLWDKEGNSLYQVLARLGYDLKAFPQITARQSQIYAALELHIEQNASLEQSKIPVGVVKAICAPTDYTITVTGCQSHAGGTSMLDRRDAYTASCEIVLEIERLARNGTSEYTTATVGKVEVIPNAANVIPGKVVFSLDIRDTSYEHKQVLLAKLREFIQGVEQKRGVTVTLFEHYNDYPVQCNRTIMDLLEKYCTALGYPYKEMISGPYHDAMLVGHFAPVAMLFVPSKNGISHSPDEWTDYADIAKGVDVLANTLFELANNTGALG
jgi:ureidoglycolate amidohydrolase